MVLPQCNYLLDLLHKIRPQPFWEVDYANLYETLIGKLINLTMTNPNIYFTFGS